ncbi:MAG: cysteine peptidase family C39 domain-containing protein [Rhodobacteraceae bacterium]|nr:cysteine peptidase family C39 domain-containing protein [Paracoccaceae bacterium]
MLLDWLRSGSYWPGAIWTLLRQRRKFVQQTTRTDCGVASALTVLNLMGLPGDPVHGVEAMDPDRTGTSLETLRVYFEQHYGLDATALSVPASRVGEIKGQVILHMRQMHYVVLLRVSKAGILVFDPSLGPVHYPIADFETLYSGYLLQVKRLGWSKRAGALPSKRMQAPVPRAKGRLSAQPVALFIIGVAMRLMECALLLCLVAVLFLVLNRASFPSLLASFAVIVVAGLLLLLARQIRFEGEDRWARGKQSRLWRSILRTSFRGRDLHGFRGRMERDVASTVRRGLAITIPQRAQVPATLGAFAIMPVMLSLLSPWLGLVYVGYYALVLIVAQLDGIQVCRRSVKGKIGRYSKLTQGRDLINGGAAPELIGEVAKWTVIGVAGYAVLTGTLPAVALMFWILTAMQIVPIDFRRASLLTPDFGAHDPIPGLTGTEVELRRQKVIGPVELSVTRERNQMRIDGLAPLTMTLQQPDLTVREQRLIMADVVAHTIRNLPEEDRVAIGPIRIFGPGQGALQAEFEHLIITREQQPKGNLPVVRDGRKTMDSTLSDPVLRDLISCEPGDFPVFWDVRSRLAISDLEARADIANCPLVGHLTMGRLTLIAKAG